MTLSPACIEDTNGVCLHPLHHHPWENPMDTTGAQQYIEAIIASDERLAHTMVEIFTSSKRNAAAHILRDLVSSPRNRFAIELSTIITDHLRYRHSLLGPSHE